MSVARPDAVAPTVLAPTAGGGRAVIRTPGSGARRLAVAVHGIEPAHFERCALIRDWLLDAGIERATLLVVPARDMHPVGQRAPALVDWLSERRRAGDEIAQHGLRHQGARAGSTPLRAFAGRATASSEFAGLSLEEAGRVVRSGWRLLKLAGIEPQGFVAPAYGYTRELHAALDHRFDWWADMRAVRPVGRDGGSGAPALGLSSASLLARSVSPMLLGATSRLAARDVRLDIHLADLAAPRLVGALERAVRRLAPEREAVTYGELAATSGAR
jgi:predicted deacetylase